MKQLRSFRTVILKAVLKRHHVLQQTVLVQLLLPLCPPHYTYCPSIFKTHVPLSICPLRLTGKVVLLPGNLMTSYVRVMTACRAGWHYTETPDREATISRGFPFCFNYVWPLPQQLKVHKCSFWSLLYSTLPTFTLILNLKVSQIWRFHNSAEHVLTGSVMGHSSIVVSGGLKVASSRTLRA